MTKAEYGKCEKLMEDAIQKAQTSKEEFEMMDKYAALNDYSQSMITLYNRRAERHLGYAEGINQALITLGFKHDRLKELSKLL